MLNVEERSKELVWVRGVTIDGPTSEDLDDAIWIRKTDLGYRLQVSVAGVADAIKIGSPADERAYKMVSTRYQSDHTVPMLGRHSESCLSLKPNKTHTVLTISLTLDDNLEVVERSVERRLFRSQDRLTYDGVVGLLGREDDHNVHAMLKLLRQVALGLLAKRKARGALAVYDIFKGWIVTEDGVVRQLRPDEMTIGYVMVQESMILANSELANFCAEQSIPILFRNHTVRPSAPQLREIADQVTMMMTDPETYGPATLSKRLKLIMEPATYSPYLQGHYALDLPAYGHFTSPIRRYADLVNHRQLLAHIDGQEYPYSFNQLVEMGEYLATRARENKKTQGMRYHEAEVQKGRDSLRSGYLETLDNSQFRMVMKCAVEEHNLTSALEAEICLRIHSGRLSPRDLVYLLHSAVEFPEWTAVKNVLEDRFQKSPSKATDVLMVGAAMGLWGEPKWGVGGTNEYIARVEMGDSVFEYKFPWKAGKKLTRAKHLASRQLLARMFVLNLASDQPSTEESLPILSVVELKKAIPTQNYKGRLGEVCMALQLIPAQYTCSHKGPDNEREFTCVGTLNYEGKEYVSQGCTARRKKDAEQLAAQDLLTQIGYYQ